ncbi:MAG: tetratricopeptide repeat protein [Pirellulaceae bacterium]|nr:tetratricopeptide repeat protein [Pirellulaceae bacterium]
MSDDHSPCELPNSVLALLLIALPLVAYWPVLDCGYIWDDDQYVVNNETLRDVQGLKRIWMEPDSLPQYYPLVHTTFWIEYQLWKLEPAGYHVVNVLLHVISSLILWRLLVLLQLSGAWYAAAIFAIHPVHVESVAWITERKNTLSACFYLAAALAYLRFTWSGSNGYGKHKWRWYGLAVFFYGAALCSKTITVTLPAALAVVLWWQRGRLGKKELVPLLPLVCLGIPLGLLTIWIEKYHVGTEFLELDLSLVDRLLIAGRAVCFYVQKLCWPSPLTFIYPRWEVSSEVWWQFVYPAAAGGIIIGLWHYRAKIGRGPLAAVLFFIGTLSPALGFVDTYPMRYSFVADHFQYLASVGMIALVVSVAWWGGVRQRWGKRVPAALFAVVIGVLAVATWQQCGVYKNIKTLWSDVVKKNPHCPIALTSMGALAEQQGDLDEAIRLHQAALAIDPSFYEAHNNLAVAFVQRRQYVAARKEFEQALLINPNLVLAQINLGIVKFQEGRQTEAIRTLKAALSMPRATPHEIALAHRELGRMYVDSDELDAALDHFRNASTFNVQDSTALINAGILCLEMKRNELAIEFFEQAVERSPQEPQMHLYLGQALKEVAREADAREAFLKALSLDANLQEARQELRSLSFPIDQESP